MWAKFVGQLAAPRFGRVLSKCGQRRLPMHGEVLPSQSVQHCSERRKHNKGDDSNNSCSAFALPLVALLAAQVEDSEGDKEIVKLLHKGQNMLHTNCSPQKVEEVYLEALHIALGLKDHEKIAYVQDRLANLALRTGELEKAEALFKNVIQNLLASGVRDNNPAVLEISLKLTTIYASLEKFALANAGYTWVIETLRKNIKDLKTKDMTIESSKLEHNNQLALLGMSLDSYGRYLFYQDRNQESLEATREAASISVELFGDKDIRTLVLYNDIGAILNQMGKSGEAIEIIQKSISMSKGVAHHGELAVFLGNLANIYKAKGETENARKALQCAMKEAELSKDTSLQEDIKNMSTPSV